MLWLTCWSPVSFLFLLVIKKQYANRHNLHQKLSGLNLCSKTSCQQNSMMRLQCRKTHLWSSLTWSDLRTYGLKFSTCNLPLFSAVWHFFPKLSNHAMQVLRHSTDFCGFGKWKQVFPSPCLLNTPTLRTAAFSTRKMAACPLEVCLHHKEFGFHLLQIRTNHHVGGQAVAKLVK